GPAQRPHPRRHLRGRARPARGPRRAPRARPRPRRPRGGGGDAGARALPPRPVVSGGQLLALGASFVLVLFAAVLAVAEPAFPPRGRARAEAIDGGENGNGDEPKRGGLAALVARRSQVLNPILF